MSAPESRALPISSIEALGVLGEFDYAVNFEPDAADSSPLRVIYAENGMGKTTFLRAVYFLLTPEVESLQSLYELAVNTVTVHLSSGARIHFARDLSEDGGFTCTLNRPNSGGELTIGFVGDEAISRAFRRIAARAEMHEYFQALRVEVARTVLVGDDRLIYSALDAPGVPPSPRTLAEDREARFRARTHASSVRDSLDRVEKALSRTAFAGISRESAGASSGVYLEITKRILAGGTANASAAEAKKDLLDRARAILKKADYEKYGLINLGQVRGMVEEFERTRTNDSRFRSLFPVLDPYLTNLADRIEALQQAQRLIDTFVTSVNGFLTRKELRFSTLDGISIMSQKGDLLDPDGLSSGEKHLLLLLSNAVLATFTGSLVIIDEPELSLGIRWQRSLLPELLRCTAGSRVQFLVASHSVQIMGDIEDVVSPTERD
jgi:hypothetical protein